MTENVEATFAMQAVDLAVTLVRALAESPTKSVVARIIPEGEHESIEFLPVSDSVVVDLPPKPELKNSEQDWSILDSDGFWWAYSAEHREWELVAYEQGSHATHYYDEDTLWQRDDPHYFGFKAWKNVVRSNGVCDAPKWLEEMEW